MFQFVGRGSSRIAFAIALGVASIAGADLARAQVTVQVIVNNTTGAKVGGVFQSTDVGDIGTSCLAGANPNPGIAPATTCAIGRSYNSPPKNIKNLLCITQKVTPLYSPQCQSLMASGNCKKNNIWTTLCYTGSKTRAVPGCIYQTGSSGVATWTWTVTPASANNQMNVDCSISGYQGPQAN